MENVIIIGDSYSMSLGLIRSLGIKGYKTILLRKTRNLAGRKTPEEFSKYLECSYRVLPEEASIMNQLNAISVNNKTLIVPGDDASCLFLDNNHEALKEKYYLPSMYGKGGELGKFMDKMEQKKLAKICGLLVAEGDYFSTDDEGKKLAAQKVKYPCFVKPLISAGISKETIGICNDETELMKSLEQAKNSGCETVLIERKLEVRKEYVCNGVSLKDQVILPACIVVNRRGKGRRKGVTAEGTVYSSDLLGDIKSKLELFVQKTELIGLFDIELMVCDDGIYFCEMNLRNGATGYALLLAGINLPGYLADYIYHGKIPATVPVPKSITFNSEKVELDGYNDGYSTYKQYHNILSNSAHRFIRDEQDNKPFIAYKKLEMITVLRKLKRSIKWK